MLAALTAIVLFHFFSRLAGLVTGVATVMGWATDTLTFLASFTAMAWVVEYAVTLWHHLAVFLPLVGFVCPTAAPFTIAAAPVALIPPSVIDLKMIGAALAAIGSVVSCLRGK